jgi:hypothetical protein
MVTTNLFHFITTNTLYIYHNINSILTTSTKHHQQHALTSFLTRSCHIFPPINYWLLVLGSALHYEQHRKRKYM